MYTLEKIMNEWVIYDPKGLPTNYKFDLPNEIEVNVEELGINTIGEITRYGDANATIGSSKRSYYETELIGFIKGYNKRAKTHKYTEADIIKAFNNGTFDGYFGNAENYLKSLPLAKSYEIEISEPIGNKVKILKFKEI